MLTEEQLKKIVPNSFQRDRIIFLNEFNSLSEEHGIIGKIIPPFIGEVAHESGNFHYLKEIASGIAYEGRKDLGNVFKGDGVKFKGRGYIQITGRANYTDFKIWLGGQPDIVLHPEYVEKPHLAMLATLWFWNSHNLNAYAGNMVSLTRRINGGLNGLKERIAIYERAKEVLNT